MNVLMDKKRAAVVALLTVFLGTAALFVGGAAHADDTGASTHCTNGAPTETDVPNGFVGLSYEHSSSNPGHVQVCYSTTPNGSSSPEAAGGKFVVYDPRTYGQLAWECRGDRATSQVVAVDCDGQVTEIDPSSAPGSTLSAFVQVGPTSPVPLGQTGAEVDPATTTDAPLSGGTTTGGSVGVGGGTCVYADGTPTCPLTATTIAAVTVNEADVALGTHPNTGCVTAVGNPCVTTVPTGMGVSYLKGDPANDTVTAEAAGIPHSQDLGDCAGVNSGPGCSPAP